jgi:hypothetical protein
MRLNTSMKRALRAASTMSQQLVRPVERDRGHACGDVE